MSVLTEGFNERESTGPPSHSPFFTTSSECSKEFSPTDFEITTPAEDKCVKTLPSA